MRLGLIVAAAVLLMPAGVALACGAGSAAIYAAYEAAGGAVQPAADKPRRQQHRTEVQFQEAPPLPERRPAPVGEASKVGQAEKPAAARPLSAPLGPPPPPPEWTQEEIKVAEAACRTQLDHLPLAFEKLKPIREGVCGDPAPILVQGFTDSPRLLIRPAAVMNCKMAAALRKWVGDVVQPRAKELLHASVIRFDNASAYVCRTRYNAPDERMSEHAFANAFDVSGFITAKGERIDILEHWDAGDERAQFLREIHAGACRIFATTLGPEANEAHRNHFHFDMAKRRSGFKLCDFARGRAEASRKTPVFPTTLPRKTATPADANARTGAAR